MSRNVPGVLDHHPHAHCSHSPLSSNPTLIVPFFELYMDGSVECVLFSITFVRFILDLACDGRQLIFITDGMPQCAYTTISFFIQQLKTLDDSSLGLLQILFYEPCRMCHSVNAWTHFRVLSAREKNGWITRQLQRIVVHRAAGQLFLGTRGPVPHTFLTRVLHLVRVGTSSGQGDIAWWS